MGGHIYINHIKQLSELAKTISVASGIDSLILGSDKKIQVRIATDFKADLELFTGEPLGLQIDLSQIRQKSISARLSDYQGNYTCFKCRAEDDKVYRIRVYHKAINTNTT